MSLDFLKRPEFVTIIVALVISALAAGGVGVCAPPEASGVLLPEVVLEPASNVGESAACVPPASVQEVVTVFWAIFVGAVVEGKYKGINYAGSLWQILSGSKFRLGLLVFAAVVINALLQPLGYGLSSDSIHSICNIILAAIGLKTVGDVAWVLKRAG